MTILDITETVSEKPKRGRPREYITAVMPTGYSVVKPQERLERTYRPDARDERFDGR